jgi:phosphoglycolate phosphatase-like HAD superfamily hydrolase
VARARGVGYGWLPMPSRPIALLWDNDGVLVDTEGLYFRATRDVLATVGIDLDEALYLQLFLREGAEVEDGTPLNARCTAHGCIEAPQGAVGSFDGE